MFMLTVVHKRKDRVEFMTLPLCFKCLNSTNKCDSTMLE